MQSPFLVVGAAHWDVIARASGPLGDGADVPGRVARRPGGVALNLALGLAAAGQAVELVAALGRDPAGDALAAVLAGAGVGTGGMLRQGATDAYVAIETDSGALHAAVADCAGLERAGGGLLAGLDRLPMPWPGTVVVDGNLAASVLARLVAHPGLAEAGVVLVPASPAKAGRLAALLARPRVALYVNRAEAEVLAGAPLAESRVAALALRRLGAERAVVTDGAGPATAADAAGVVTRAPRAAVGSATGAGDRFVARHLAALAGGCAAEDALALALEAATRHIDDTDPVACGAERR